MPCLLTNEDRGVRCDADSYTWTWSQDTDAMRVYDRHGALVVAATLTPVITVGTHHDEGTGQGISSRPVHLELGPAQVSTRGTTLLVRWQGLDAVVTTTWRFASDCFWAGPFELDDPLGRPVISVHPFADVLDGVVTPTLDCSYLIQPGLSASPGLSPIIDRTARLSMRSWLGRGSMQDHRVQHAQWGLPVLYFAGVSMDRLPTQRDALVNGLSEAFCCGLADLPAADVSMLCVDGRHSPVFEYREDLWGPRDQARSSRGATWLWATAETYRDAIAAYYGRLTESRHVVAATPSPAKAEILRMSQFNTWGAQAGNGTQWEFFTGSALSAIAEQVHASEMRPELFVIDDKWEGQYGLLEHSEERFPDFEAQLDELRTDGYRIGLWAAFLRCEDPSAVGLDLYHMLRGPDGSAHRVTGRDGDYYLYDLTQPAVAEVVGELARRFARRYRPDLIKFDFGYELPSLSVAAPQDLRYGGERMLSRGLEVVVGALREVLPDIVVMYYQLSPLLHEYIDLHSIDDLWLAGEEYALEANRRLYFSSLLGLVGMPSYGSGGYDWSDLRQTWFDTVAAGTIGSLGSFTGDPGGSQFTLLHAATFAGLNRVLRSPASFEVAPLQSPRLGFATAARSSSWARCEEGATVLVALRPETVGGRPGVPTHAGVRSDVQVVVSSLDDLPLGRTTHLGVVPFGPGTVTVPWGDDTSPVPVTEYGLSGRCTHLQAERSPEHANSLGLRVRTQTPDGDPVVWLEVGSAATG